MENTSQGIRGRTRELCLLDEIARRTARGESLLGHVIGPAGMGKTALLDVWQHRLGDSITVHRIPVRPLDSIWSDKVHAPLLAVAESRRPLHVGQAQSARLAERASRPNDSFETDPVTDSGVRDATFRRQLVDPLTTETTGGPPTLFVFEDTHWAQPSLHQLIADLCVHDIANLSVILAYREGLAPPIPASGRNEIHVRLNPLQRSHLHALAIDHLKEQAVTEELVDHLDATSSGLALAAVQELQLIRESGDSGIPSDLGIRPDPGSIYTRDLHSLSDEARTFIQVAALLGDGFDVSTIATCLGWPFDVTKQASEQAQSRTVVFQASDEVMAFAHDELRDAVLEELGSGRVALSYKCGWNLAQEDHDQAFQAALLLLRGADELLPEHHDEVVRLWVDAGAEALQLGDFSLSHRFLTTAWRAMRRHGAVDTSRLHAIAEASWLVGNSTVTGEVLEFANSSRDHNATVDLAYFHMRSLAANDEFDAAIDVALGALARLGVDFPTNPAERHVAVSFLRVMARLRKVDAERIKDLPTADRHEAAVQRLMAGLVALSYAERPALFPLVALEGVRRVFSHGVSSFTPVALIGFATIAAIGAKHELSLRWGQAAMDLASQPGFEQSAPWTAMQYYDFVHHWHGISHDALEPLKEAFEQALQIADLQTAGLVASVWTSTAFMTGRPMQEIDDRFDVVLPHLAANNVATRMAGMTRQLIQAVGGTTSNYQAPPRDHDDQLTVTVDHICDHAVEFFIGDPAAARAKAHQAAERLEGVRGTSNMAGFRLTYALTLAQANAPRSELRPVLKRSIRDFKKWVKFSPWNYAPGLRLLQAELARLDGNTSGALDHYQATITASEGSVHQLMTAAFAKTRAGDLEFAAGRFDAARGWFDAAELAWQRIGAYGVIKQMRSRYVLPATRSAEKSGFARMIEANRELLTLALKTMTDALPAQRASIVETVDDISVMWLEHRRVERMPDTKAKTLSIQIGASGLALEVEVDQLQELTVHDNAELPGYAAIASVLAPTRALATRPRSHISLEEYVRELFGAAAERVLRGGVAETELTVLAVDIVNYTGRIESISPLDGVRFLNNYLDAMTQPILEHGGLTEPREGDTIMGLFSSAEAATRAALALPAALAEFNASHGAEQPTAYRAGIATGQVAVAMVDTGGQKSLIHAGDVLNLASRLNNAASQLDYDLLVDSSTVRSIDTSEFVVVAETAFGVTNRATPVHCYRVLATDETVDLTTQNLATLQHDLSVAELPLRQIAKSAAGTLAAKTE